MIRRWLSVVLTRLVGCCFPSELGQAALISGQGQQQQRRAALGLGDGWGSGVLLQEKLPCSQVSVLLKPASVGSQSKQVVSGQLRGG